MINLLINFVDKHQQENIRYFFIIYVCPLSPFAQVFTIALIPKTSGNANKDIVQRVNSRSNVIETSFDGNSG